MSFFSGLCCFCISKACRELFGHLVGHAMHWHADAAEVEILRIEPRLAFIVFCRVHMHSSKLFFTCLLLQAFLPARRLTYRRLGTQRLADERF